MKTSDFDYELPEELIAQTPAEPRDSSRMLCYRRDTDEVSHRIFRDLPEILRPGDLLVRNNTRVLPRPPLRLHAARGKSRGAPLKAPLPRRVGGFGQTGKKAREGAELFFSEELSLVVKGRTGEGERIVEFRYDGVFEDIISRLGEMPLPPYIHEKLADGERYQTVYSKVNGSAAAPTAGLHFTPALFDRPAGKRRGNSGYSPARGAGNLPSRQGGGNHQASHALGILRDRRDQCR